MDFKLEQPVKIIFGAGKIQEIGELMSELGFKKALIVCDEGIKKVGIAGKIEKAIEKQGHNYSTYANVRPEPSYKNVEDGYSQYKNDGCDSVIAVGGGSSIDVAKGINILRVNGGSILNYSDPNVHMKKCNGLIAVPTTSGTGSELSDGLVIGDEKNVKCPILATNAMVEYAVIDPELMVGIPKHITVYTGLDALSHAIESYTSVNSDIFCDMISEKSIETIVKWLPEIIKDGSNIEARSFMAATASMCGWMLRYGHTHSGHSIAHELGNMLKLPHGMACALAIADVIEYNAIACPDKTKKIGELLGVKYDGNETSEEIGKKARKAYEYLRDVQLEVKPIEKIICDEEKLTEAAETIVNDIFQVFNPRKMDVNDAKEILKNICVKNS